MSHKEVQIHDANDILTTVRKPNNKTVIERLVNNTGEKLTMATGNGPPTAPIEGATAYLDLLTGEVYVWSDE